MNALIDETYTRKIITFQNDIQIGNIYLIQDMLGKDGWILEKE